MTLEAEKSGFDRFIIEQIANGAEYAKNDIEFHSQLEFGHIAHTKIRLREFLLRESNECRIDVESFRLVLR